MRTRFDRTAGRSIKTGHSASDHTDLIPGQAAESCVNGAIALPRTTSKAYSSHGGAYYVGDTVSLLKSKPFKRLHGQVQLILTSPPYPLNKKKSYGNLTGEAYVEWIESLAPLFSDLLTDDGSLVIELGNSWEPERPVQSLLALKALMALATAKGTGLRLIQQFICHNPSRLPSPAAWVTVQHLRAVDSFTHVWWLAKSDYPKADNQNVLRPYSKSMEQLLRRGRYNHGARPSEHRVGETSFLKDRGGSIAQSVFEIDPIIPGSEARLPNAFSYSNTGSNDFFHKACKEKGITPHPARMPLGMASYFIEFLTDKNDLVLDPFGGSNTTGYAAARAERRWVAIDAKQEYADQSRLRFDDPALTKKEEDR
jgi:hypothetical protein